MQVRKFEAKTMKEALELVKINLGPEAIILSAKDNSRGFGLIGQKSIEVTAAIAEKDLHKKKFAESKLKPELREQFRQIPASRQKQFIDKAIQKESQGAHSATSELPRPTGKRYIDIVDEEPVQTASTPTPAPAALSQKATRTYAPSGMVGLRSQQATSSTGRETGTPASAKERIGLAVRRAFEAGKETLQGPRASISSAESISIEQQEIHQLKSQIVELKSILDKFHKVPQNFVSLHPGAEEGLAYEVSAMFQKLLHVGISRATIVQMLLHAQQELNKETLQKPSLIEAWVVRYLLSHIEVASNPRQGRYHLFFGGAGQGKTTTMIKFASQLILRERARVALITTDTVKVGAADQMRIYAQILNVPFAMVRQPSDWAVIESKLNDYDHIFVDFPGLNLSQTEQVEWLRHILPPPELNSTRHLVQSILTRDEDAYELAAKYQTLGLDDLIFTRLDEANALGLIVNLHWRTHLPIHSFGTGRQVPEDFEYAHKEQVVDLLMKITRANKERGTP